MKIASIKVKNVKSFKEELEISFDNNFNIFIGPNGGGKSNILDIITIAIRQFLLKGYRVTRETQNNKDFFDSIHEHLIFQDIEQQLSKFIGDSSESYIQLKLQVTKTDIKNIQAWKNHRATFENQLNLYKYKPITNLSFLDTINFSLIKENDELNYFIRDNGLIPVEQDTPEYAYFQYLKYLELFLILNKNIKNIKITPIYLYFSPYRGDNQQTLQANLSSDNYYDLLINYFGSTSKNVASLIKVSSLYFAEKRRNYESNSSTSGYETAWKEDKEVQLVNKYLDKLGYSWSLQLKDQNRNIYEIVLTKENKSFDILQASSGEKEIINFLLGVFAFNIEGGLIIIDEPELHLHPKWQSILIDLFLDLSIITNNQFVLTTHSPIFINETTISNIIRVYRENDISKTISFEKNIANSAKDLLHIINSMNNEKMFFADKVVLVEGIKDRLLFRKIIDTYCPLFINKPEIIEVLEVTGKSNLLKYRDFLNSIKVKNYIIADDDYILTIGNEDVKKLFVIDEHKIDKSITDKKSKDGISLAAKLNTAIVTGDMEELKYLWAYIKKRHKKLKENLTEEESNTLNSFLDKKFKEKVYILKKGEIENYIKNGYKELDKVIQIVKADKIIDYLNPDNIDEINQIIFDILEVAYSGKQEIEKRLTTVQVQNL